MDRPTDPDDRAAAYRARDLHDEGVWPPGPKARYGGVVFDARGRILLREPTGHYGGYRWTFPKGTADPGEHPVDAARREVLEETGHRPTVVDHLPGVYRAGPTATSNYFYVMVDADGVVDRAAMDANGETADLRWATREEARRLVGATPNPAGRRRDLEVLEAAFDRFGAGPAHARPG